MNWLRLQTMLEPARRVFLLSVGMGALLFAVTWCTGCSPSAYARHYQAIGVATGAHTVAVEVSDETRAARLDALSDPEAIRAEGERWRPVGVTLDGFLDAVKTWARSVRRARETDDEGLLPSLSAQVATLGEAWATLSTLLAGYGVELPALGIGGES